MAAGSITGSNTYLWECSKVFWGIRSLSDWQDPPKIEFVNTPYEDGFHTETTIPPVAVDYTIKIGSNYKQVLEELAEYTKLDPPIHHALLKEQGHFGMEAVTNRAWGGLRTIPSIYVKEAIVSVATADILNKLGYDGLKAENACFSYLINKRKKQGDMEAAAKQMVCWELANELAQYSHEDFLAFVRNFTPTNFKRANSILSPITHDTIQNRIKAQYKIVEYSYPTVM